MNLGISCRVSGVGLVLLLAGCGGGGEAECALDADCPVGRYCAAGACTYDCAVDAECPQGHRCDSARGRCVEGCVRTNGGVEACDGVDNDCDAETDEDFPDLGTACQNGGCPPGEWVCAQDGLSTRCTGPLPAPSDPTCDGRDEDCDGQTDEDAPPQACPLQLGVCAGAEARCAGGAYPACDYGPAFSPEADGTCDELDNDCDGATDEDALRLEPETGAQATDGLDNNCNGLTDEPGGVLVPLTGHPGVWVDAYEATLFEHPDCTGARYGESADDYPAGFPAEGAATLDLHACSLPGLIPSGHLSYHRAARACLAQGKRLCTGLEWSSACHGEVGLFPYGWNFAARVCNDGWSGAGAPVETGSLAGCTAGNGVFDTSGNLSEWLEQGYEDPAYPELRCTGGFGFQCELCNKGQSCQPCNPDDPDDREDALMCLDCLLGGLDPDKTECFPQALAKPYMGVRCCYDGPP